MANQGTIRLKVTNGTPAIEKLWNGRFKLEFFCENNSPKEDWYYDNIGAILPDYGILQEANFGSGVSEDWEAIPSSVYPDMRLVLAEYPYNVRAGKHYVKLTYETLTASWVEEKEEDTDYELNGLKKVSRTFVALPGTTYDKVVGTSTIDSNGTTLYLAAFKIEETDAKWSLSEIWLEAGELNREENSEDAKGAISITQIGGCPEAPVGYTVVNESKNDTQGFETCSRTFYKNDSELSRSNDYIGSQLSEVIEVFSPTAEPIPTNGTAVLGNKSTSNVDGIPTTRYTFLVPSILSEASDKIGSQLSITIEAFNETPATPNGYVIASEQASDVEGIPTTRYTFLKPSVLSQSEDNVGSQLAITIEAFSEVPATPAGYVVASEQVSDFEGIPTKRYTFLKPSILSQTEDNVGSQKAIVIEAFDKTPAAPSGYILANEQVSDFEGIKTKRFTFLKPSILSLQQELIGGTTTVVVEAFSKTEAQVDSEISAITDNHLLVSKDESDFDGIKTTQFRYNIDVVEIIDFSENNLLVIQETELSINDFTTGIIGTTTKSHSGKTLYLGGETIDNNNSIKTRIRKWFEAGLLSETFRTADDGLVNYTRVWLKEVGTSPAIPAGSVITSEEIGDYNGLRTINIQYRKLPTSGTFTYQTTIPFTIPGTVEVLEDKPFNNATKNLVLDLTPPTPTTVAASVEVTYSTNQNVSTSNLWQPTEWASSLITGIGEGSTPIYSASTYSKYIRIGNGETVSAGGYLTGVKVIGSSNGRIDLEGPTYDPAGKSILVSISNDPVFSDKNGVQYYKKTLVTATIPPRP